MRESGSGSQPLRGPYPGHLRSPLCLTYDDGDDKEPTSPRYGRNLNNVSRLVLVH